MYSYHKQYVEKYNNFRADDDINDVSFNMYFLEAIKHLYNTTHDYVYKIFLIYNGFDIADIDRIQEHNLSYRAT